MQYTVKVVISGDCGTDLLGIGHLITDWCKTHQEWYAQTGVDGVQPGLELNPGTDGIPEASQKYTFSGMLPDRTAKESIRTLFQELADFLQEKLNPEDQKTPVEVIFGLKIR